MQQSHNEKHLIISTSFGINQINQDIKNLFGLICIFIHLESKSDLLNKCDSFRKGLWNVRILSNKMFSHHVSKQGFTCDNCNRLCRSRTGLFSHSRHCTSTTDWLGVDTPLFPETEGCQLIASKIKVCTIHMYLCIYIYIFIKIFIFEVNHD